MQIKLTREEAEELARYMENPAFQMTPRHALYVATVIESSKGFKQRKEEAKKFADDEHFLLKFQHDYFFYRYVKRNEITKQSYWNQVREISYLILLDLLHPEKAIPTMSLKKPKHSAPLGDGTLTDWKSESTLKRIRKDYPEIFYTPHDCRQNRQDQRETRYLTVFSDLPLENDESWGLAVTLLQSLDYARADFMDDYMKVRPVMAGLRMVDPEDLIGLERFWKILKDCLQIISEEHHQSTHNKWLPNLLKERTNLLEHMYQLIDQAIALHWYRNIKSEPKKLQIIRMKAPWTYTEEDAKKAVDLNFKWFENSVTATDLIARGADAYAYIGMHKIALTLYNECLNYPLTEKSGKGYIYFELARVYSQMKDWTNCLESLTKSQAIYEEIGNQYKIGVTWGYIAEANHMQNNHEKYADAKNKAMSILSVANAQDEPSNEALSEAYLDLADCAQRTKDREWEEKSLNLAFEPASNLKDFTKAQYISQRLGDLMAGKDTAHAEEEPNKIKRPLKSYWDVGLTRAVAKVPKEL